MHEPIFETSANTRLLRQKLATVRIGETISYDDLSAVISRPVNASTGALRTARRSLFKSDGFIFSPITGAGLKRLTDADKVDAADLDLQKVRRASRRGVERLASVQNYAALPPQKQLAHTAKMAALTAAAFVTTDERVAALEDKCSQGSSRGLPIATTLELMIPKR